MICNLHGTDNCRRRWSHVMDAIGTVCVWVALFAGLGLIVALLVLQAGS